MYTLFHPLPSSQVPFRLHGSPSIFTGPLPSSRVPFRLHGSPSVFTGPLPSSRVPFLLHRSPSVFTGPLPSSRVPGRIRTAYVWSFNHYTTPTFGFMSCLYNYFLSKTRRRKCGGTLKPLEFDTLFFFKIFF